MPLRREDGVPLRREDGVPFGWKDGVPSQLQWTVCLSGARTIKSLGRRCGG